jgi:hypothetical protein
MHSEPPSDSSSDPVAASALRERILAAFTPGMAQITLVADSDGLIDDELVLSELRRRGFGILFFDDSIAFRYRYEGEFRAKWEEGESLELIVIIKGDAGALDALPWDVLSAGQRVTLSLADLFPNLSPAVVAALDRASLDRLYQAQTEMRLDLGPAMLGEDATKDFVLHHVFGLHAETIRTPATLLQMLLQLHEQQRQLPAMLAQRVAEKVQGRNSFADWPLARLLHDRNAFYTFLQERWPAFIRTHMKPDISGLAESPALTVEGPALLPFDDEQVWPHVDTLFLDGRLQPMRGTDEAFKAEGRLGIGVQFDEAEARRRRFQRLIDALSQSVPDDQARHTEWASFALRWAEVTGLWHDHRADLSQHAGAAESFQSLQARMDEAFLDWLTKRYAGLHNLSPSAPAMVHHIARFLARRIRENRQAKVALIVVDGLSLDQWLIVRERLKRQRPALQMNESAVFAWIPTLTSVSRQAIFAGAVPALFPAHIHTTAHEENAWRKFWLEQGLSPAQVGYKNGVHTTGDVQQIEPLLVHPQMRVIGMVLDSVDRIMHGEQLGMAGMRHQVSLWAGQNLLTHMIDRLLAEGFEVYVTSDHGNMEARGAGTLAGSELADIRASRVRIFGDEALRRRALNTFSDAIVWNSTSLPPEVFALLAPGRMAFTSRDSVTVAHGGASLEETVIPFVSIGKGV